MEIPVMEFLDGLVKERLGKDRSAVFNLVVREYAKRIRNTTLPSAKITSIQPELSASKE